MISLNRVLRGTAATDIYRCFGSWATVDPDTLSGKNPAVVQNFVDGEWKGAEANGTIPDPLNGEPFIQYSSTGSDEITPFIEGLQRVPKSGLHNAYKKPDRYLMYGEITAKVVTEMRKPEVIDFFTKLIQRVVPKSDPQARGEVTVSTRFLENFCGDQVRFLARGFSVPGDHLGQQSHGLRWPYGPVALITPFNFPFEIPVLQLMGALYMGNRPLVHVDHRVSIVLEQYLRLLLHCGMPATDLDFINGQGKVVSEILAAAKPRNTLFTGSSRIGEKIAVDLSGKVKLEDAGFDWKILGPDVSSVPHAAWVCDQDAYAFSGQKCSAQSILFAHENWVNAGLFDAIKNRAASRNLKDLTVGPVITWTTGAMLKHVESLLEIPGARLMFGGKALTGHSIPDCYGAIEPTAVYVPLDKILDKKHFELATTEVFGPLQVVTDYKDSELDKVLEVCEGLEAHLTAAVVSNDPVFLTKVLGSTVNGTTYAGWKARTTGAPQNHWFGPAGDPRGAGIGTPEAIKLVWSCHREVIHDVGPLMSDAEARKLKTS
ncbi:hypothetical protein BSKO_00257 [Bryopsis sp. KO-2023]|nr:hypothetical protein BSKO_00257 [Bryopsis sp. KO-2023]